MVDYPPPSLTPRTTTGSQWVMLLVPCMVPPVVQKQACLHQLYRAALLASNKCWQCTSSCNCHPTQPLNGKPLCAVSNLPLPTATLKQRIPGSHNKSTSPRVSNLRFGIPFRIKTVWLHSQLNHKREPAQTVAEPQVLVVDSTRRPAIGKGWLAVRLALLQEPAVPFHWEGTSAKKRRVDAPPPFMAAAVVTTLSTS
jgi:hypothetical protein